MFLSVKEFTALELLQKELSLQELIHAAMHGFTIEDNSNLNQCKSDLCRLALKMLQ